MEIAQDFSEKIYQILCSQIGQKWSNIWVMLRNSLKTETHVALLIKDAISNHVATHVFVDKDLNQVYNRSIPKWQKKAPLEFGAFYVDPVSKTLCMVGYTPEPTKQNREIKIKTESNEAQEEKVLERLSEHSFLVQCRGNMLCEVSYGFLPTWEHFREPINFFGHPEYLKNRRLPCRIKIVGYAGKATEVEKATDIEKATDVEKTDSVAK